MLRGVSAVVAVVVIVSQACSERTVVRNDCRFVCGTTSNVHCTGPLLGGSALGSPGLTSIVTVPRHVPVRNDVDAEGVVGLGGDRSATPATESAWTTQECSRQAPPVVSAAPARAICRARQSHLAAISALHACGLRPRWGVAVPLSGVYQSLLSSHKAQTNLAGEADGLALRYSYRDASPERAHRLGCRLCQRLVVCRRLHRSVRRFSLVLDFFFVLDSFLELRFFRIDDPVRGLRRAV